MSNIGNKEIFARNLSYYVMMSGRDQKEIAEVVGVAPSTFNEWVKGKKYPRIDKIEMLANYFRILKSDLIEDKTEKNTPEEPRLTEGEKVLLGLFNKVPKEKQEFLIHLIRAYLETPKQ